MSFPWEQALLRAECAAVFQNGSFSPSSARSMRAFFSSTFCGNLVELLEVSLRKLWDPVYDRIPLKFLNRRLVYTEPLAICHVRFGFSSPCSGSHLGFCLCISAPGRWDSLSVFGAAFCPVSSLLVWIQEELLNFQSVQFFTCCSSGSFHSEVTCKTRALLDFFSPLEGYIVE